MSRNEDIEELARVLEPGLFSGAPDDEAHPAIRYRRDRTREQAEAVLDSSWFGAVCERVRREWIEELGGLGVKAEDFHLPPENTCELCDTEITKDHAFFHKDWVHVHSDSRWCDFIDNKVQGMARPKGGNP